MKTNPSKVPCRCGANGAQCMFHNPPFPIEIDTSPASTMNFKVKGMKEKTSMEKAYDFWFNTINENNPKFFRAGCEWMINYWQKRMIDGE